MIWKKKAQENKMEKRFANFDFLDEDASDDEKYEE
jgi:hypothetical protein